MPTFTTPLGDWVSAMVKLWIELTMQMDDTGSLEAWRGKLSFSDDGGGVQCGVHVFN